MGDPRPRTRSRPRSRWNESGTTVFDHERLDVYQTAIEFLAVADKVASDLPRGRSYLADQLRRAALSVPLNVAEGAGEFSRKDKARIYRIALRSATECAAVLDVCRALELVDISGLLDGRNLLLRIVSMLTRMTKVGNGDGDGNEGHAQ
jgi:four helix bundle protein